MVSRQSLAVAVSPATRARPERATSAATYERTTAGERTSRPRHGPRSSGNLVGLSRTVVDCLVASRPSYERSAGHDATSDAVQGCPVNSTSQPVPISFNQKLGTMPRALYLSC
jgi:hypothetical protein